MIATTDRAEWLQERMTGLGGSDAADALGVGRRGRFRLWSEKTGLVEAEDLSDNEAVEWGIRLEEPILRAYAERTGRAAALCEPYRIHRHPTLLWMLDTPDAFQTCAERGRGLVQIKTAGEFRAGDWEDGPPLPYQVQCQHELAVTGLAWGTLVVLIGGQRLRYYDFQRNDRFLAALVEQERAFWLLVESRTPPEPDGSEATSAALKKLYPTENGQSVVLPAEAADWDRELQAAKEQIREFEKVKTLAENRLKAALGEAECGILPNGGMYTLKSQTSHYPAKPAYDSTFRVLRRKK